MHDARGFSWAHRLFLLLSRLLHIRQLCGRHGWFDQQTLLLLLLLPLRCKEGCCCCLLTSRSNSTWNFTSDVFPGDLYMLRFLGIPNSTRDCWCGTVLPRRSHLPWICNYPLLTPTPPWPQEASGDVPICRESVTILFVWPFAWTNLLQYNLCYSQKLLQI